MSRPLMEGGKVLLNPRGPLFSTQSFGDSEIWILMLVQVQDNVIAIVYLCTNMQLLIHLINYYANQKGKLFIMQMTWCN